MGWWVVRSWVKSQLHPNFSLFRLVSISIVWLYYYFHRTHTHTHRAREALRSCLPDQLKDTTFSISLKDDSTTKKWLGQLLQNINMGSQMLPSNEQQLRTPVTTWCCKLCDLLFFCKVSVIHNWLPDYGVEMTLKTCHMCFSSVTEAAIFRTLYLAELLIMWGICDWVIRFPGCDCKERFNQHRTLLVPLTLCCKAFRDTNYASCRL